MPISGTPDKKRRKRLPSKLRRKKLRTRKIIKSLMNRFGSTDSAFPPGPTGPSKTL